GVRGWMLVAIGFIAVLGPIYFPITYVRLPKALVAPMKQVLRATARVSISPAGFTLTAKGRSFTKQWKDLREVIETPHFFLFVVGHAAFALVPKGGTPEDAM